MHPRRSLPKRARCRRRRRRAPAACWISASRNRKANTNTRLGTRRRSTSSKLLTTVRETAYRWNFPSDRIDWAPNAEAVLCVAGADMIDRGRAFALLVDPEQAGARYDGITGGPHVAPETRVALLPALSLSARGTPRPRGAVARGHRRLLDRRRGAPAPGARHAQGHQRSPRAGGTDLVYLGSHDELTGQLNRTRLTEELTRYLGGVGQNPAKGAFLLAGVNDLTLVNETYGYDVGDEVITIVGRRMGRALARQGLHRPVLVEQVRHPAAGLQRGGGRDDFPPPHGHGPRQRHRYQRGRGGDQHLGRRGAAARTCRQRSRRHRPRASGARYRPRQPQRPLQPLPAVRAPELRAPARGGHCRRDRPRAQRPPHDSGAAADRHVEAATSRSFTNACCA